MKLKVMKVDPYGKVKMPEYQTAGAAGFDLVSALPHTICLAPGNHYQFPCGLNFEIPEGFELQIRPRSGMASKFAVMTSFGTIDSDYRGEVKINLLNHGRWDYVVAPGDRIAQAVLAPIVRAEFEEVKELSHTVRGANGFGSTGR